MEADYSIRLARWGDGQSSLSEVRVAVFVREQGVPEALEWDGLDAAAVHALAESRHGLAIGTARLLADGHIGRMAVLPPWRGLGVGSALLDRLVREAQGRGLGSVWLHAQTQAVGFYRRHGFRVTSSEFLDAGLPHVAMTRPLESIQGALEAAADGSTS
jgi:predicted GNAT family N-acyltransferase